jgi:REP element-mobilizing transposase RayT
MPGWDYSGNGFYFITMIIQNRGCILGKIENNEMTLSDFGKIAEQEWYKSFEIRKELILDVFQMMPNHLHAIVVIKKNRDSNNTNNNHGTNDSHGLHDFHVETHGRASLRENPHNNAGENQSNQTEHSDQPRFYRKPKSLSSFVAGYKSAVTTKIDDFIDLHNLPIEKYNRNNRLWQANYNDHIIRNDDEYWRIKNYIKNNPKNWKDDDFYKI